MVVSKARPRKALITGASSGIGRAIADAALDADWKVIGLDNRDAAITHPNYSAIRCDLTSEGWESALSEVGKVDALIHAAGFMRVGNIGRALYGDALEMWKVHVGAAIRLVDHFAPQMGQGDRILIIGSRAADGAVGKSGYAASKSALVGLVRSWAKELGPKGITVNMISPAATETGMLTDVARSELPPELPPIGRFVSPHEIAAYILFLLGPNADAITGQNLLICGGASL